MKIITLNPVLSHSVFALPLIPQNVPPASEHLPEPPSVAQPVLFGAVSLHKTKFETCGNFHMPKRKKVTTEI